MAQPQLGQQLGQQLAQPMAQQNIGQSQMIQITQQMGQQIGQQMMQPQMVQTPMGQQMMYCPVRLVYDHSLLMQPGDQIQQQNQNIYVNQPPWARPVQNQVIYVQQIGSNLVPIQHVDPNLYLQQNMQTYPQILPQMMQQVPQGQIRPVMNNIPANLVQNFAQMQQVPEQNMGQVVQNYTYVQTNPEANAGNTNAVNNDVDRQAAANQNTMNQANQEIQQQQIFRPMQQVNQQQILLRPQIQMQVNQAQNMAQAIGTQNTQAIAPNVGVAIRTSAPNVGNNMGNVTSNNNAIPPNMQGTVTQNIISNNRIIGTQVMPNTSNIPHQSQNKPITATNMGMNTSTNLSQTVAANMPQVRHVLPTQNVNFIPQGVQQNVNNALVQHTVERNFSSANNMNTVTYSAVRNGQPYTYRAIQPKPNVGIRVNFTPRVTNPQMVRKPIPNLINKNAVNVNSTATNTHFVTTEPANQNFNRKRKSESPDEVQKKVSNFGTMTVTAQVKDKIKAKYGANTSEVGVNTSPVHRPGKKVEIFQPVLQVDPLQILDRKIKQEIVSPTSNQAPPIPTEPPSQNEIKTDLSKTEVKDASQQVETEKLVRNTVFSQARNRTLADKINVHNSTIEINATVTNTKIESIPTTTEAKIDESKVLDNGYNVQEYKTLLTLLTKENDISQKTEHNLEVKDNTTENMDCDILNAAATLEMIKNDSNKLVDSSKNVDTIAENSDKTTETNTNINKTPEIPKETKSENKPAEENAKIISADEPLKPNKDETNKSEKDTSKEPKTDISKTTEDETKDIQPEVKDKKEKKEYQNISISEMTGREIHMVDGNIHKKERDYILTHVLDGYVIQESNVPFAIRRPLKEKTINGVVDKNQDPSTKTLAQKEDIKEKILELSQLNLEEERDVEMKEVEKMEVKEESKEDIDNKEDIENKKVDGKIKDDVKSEENVVSKDNPFRGLQHSIVKSWTVDQLTAHLSAHNWSETVSLFQDQEIDGESLFLVTRTQLVTIGVSENHADLICEFLNKS